MKKFKDSYEKYFESNNRRSFKNELEDRENNTKRIKTTVSSLQFGELFKNRDGEFMFRYFSSGTDVNEIKIPVTDENREIFDETVRKGTMLCLKVSDICGTEFYPVSNVAKLSTNGKLKFSFSGEISELTNSIDRYNVPAIVAAKMYDVMLTRVTSYKVTLIIVYGKLQAIMSSRYVPTDQRDVFAKTENILQNPGFYGAYVSHKLSRAMYSVEDERLTAMGVELAVAVEESSTGYSGINIYPVIVQGNKRVGFSDSYRKKHMNISDDDLENGLNAALQQLRNSAVDLVNSTKVNINLPIIFSKNVVGELNKLAASMSSTKLTAEYEKYVTERINELSFTQDKFTLYDVISVFWELPNQFGKSEEHKRGIEKTVSRILILKDITALDA